MTYRQPDLEIHDPQGTITGTGLFDYQIDSILDADIGGVDGPMVTYCEFLGVEIGPAVIDSAVISQIIGQHRVNDLEERAIEQILQEELPES